MDDDWDFPAPMDDPEARMAKPGQESGGCPRIVPDGNFVEGEMWEEGDIDDGGGDPGGADPGLGGNH